MPAATLTARAPAPPGSTVRWTWGWIIHPRHDLAWLIGGALGGYGLIALIHGLRLNVVQVWFAWVLLIDTPHFFGTYARTYLDPEEWRRRRRLLAGSLAIFTAGPLALLLSYVLHRAGVARYALPWTLFLAGFFVWAYWHVLRQHYGIMTLYERKNADRRPWDVRIDKWLLHAGLLAPALAFAVTNPEARRAFGLAADRPADGWEAGLVRATVVVTAALGAAFAFRQVRAWRAGRPLNAPKLLFLAAVIPFYLLVGYHPAVALGSLLAFSAFVTVHHDFQYHALVWFYQRNHYHRAGGPGRPGAAAWVSRNFVTYAACALGVAAAFRLLGCSLEITPGCVPVVHTSAQPLFGTLTVRELLTSVFLGFPLHHYLVDQYLWRPGRDAALRRDLDLGGAPAGG